MLPTPHCTRCGYANAPTWARCCCCGRPLGDHRLPRRTRVVRAPAGGRPPRPRRQSPQRGRSGDLVAPAASLAAVAGAWLTPMPPDERAGVLSAAAALSAFAAIVRRPKAAAPAQVEPVRPSPREHEPRHRRAGRHDTVEDLAAIIAAW